jgi:signal transduction histidine kinase
MDPTGAPSRPRRAPPALRSRLLLLAVSLLVPALLAAGVALYAGYRRDRDAMEGHLAETARALALVVDRQLGQAEAAVWALATSPHLARGDHAALDAQARRSLRIPESWFVLEGRGRQLVNTHLPPGAPLPELPNQGHWASASTERADFGNLFTGLVSGQPSVAASLLVPGPEGSGETQHLSVIMRTTAFSRILADQNLPPRWVAAVLDRNGIVVARTRDAERFVGRPATPDVLRRVGEGMERGVFQSVSLNGVETVVALSRSPVSGWSMVVAVPRSEMTETARLTALYLVFAGGVLLALGSGLAALAARSIARPVEALAAEAAALGRGEVPGGEGTGRRPADFREVEAVREAIEGAAAALAERAAERDRAEAELRRLNETLEDRVASRTAELAAANARLLGEMEERRRAEARLSQAQRLEAVGQLTGGLAHDFNNLLMAVLGSLDVLGRRLGEGADERVRRLIENATAAAQRGSRLTQQLLAFSRRQRLDPKPVDVNASVEGIAGLIRSTMGGRIRVETRPAEGLWSAMADATQLELAVLNLALNARDAMPQGGDLVIETANATTGEPETAEAPPAGEHVAISVSDTGTGIPPEALARVFEPFFTTKEVGKGSGLGLPQVLGIAKQLGGGVAIESRPGEGTRVRVFLPRAAAPAQAGDGPAAAGPAGGAALRGRAVLLVDDDAEVRRAVFGMLREAGCRVTEAAGGLEALGALERPPVGGFDVVVLDYAMPGMTGLEAARRLRARSPGLPVVMMTGYAEVPTGEAMLQKPFRAEELLARLEREIERAATVPD